MKKLILKIDSILLFGFLKFFVKKIIYCFNKFKINNNSFVNKIYFDDHQNLLSELCEKYGSDKGFINLNTKKNYSWNSHTYSTFYHDLFSHCKENINLVFECGIGSNNEKLASNMTEEGKPGASLRVWKDYFKNANIYGADIDKDILFQEERINTFYVDQLNNESIKNMWDKIKISNFDIIIDDGLHTLESGIILFENSFDKLRKDGVYIIEDVKYSYFSSLMNHLKKFNPRGVELIYNKKNYFDNNLIMIKKK
jgi:hypothetical protein